MRYYIAGKMTGLPNFGYDRFAEVADNLRNIGLDIASPHEIDYDEATVSRGQRPYKEYLAGGLALLLECDAIILIPGWEDSRGARTEKVVAEAAGFPVFTYAEHPIGLIPQRPPVADDAVRTKVSDRISLPLYPSPRSTRY